MDRYVVIGHPVEHSRSPAIHALFAAQTGEHIDYQRQLSPLDGLVDTVEQLAARGVRGCNITVPFKFEAFELIASRNPAGLSERARRARAVNTLGLDASGWWADNTDGVGLTRDIERNAGVTLRGSRVLLLGAGGAAAGVLAPLLQAGVAELVIANRTQERAEALVRSHADLAQAQGATLLARPLADAGRAYDLVINGTASSLAGAGVPVGPEVLRPQGWAWDLMYGAGALGFLDWAAGHGARGRDGLGMLVEQAAEAFFLWRGVRPDTAPVLARLRAEVDASLGKR
ncbi:shikimate dehydrogenase [Sphaerotilus hippei]|uniref:Shikimate dehydrogenase (NADP(+)) n=1 Tax=Sphaerotilus hippei TaxID=744406 RepID=A0A318GWV6_9BURK|nr:shikimate dehydrogenase [Sphaerotilus hippei]PXW93868.1 shikimate dehydrogenase [Sphaerotilus hippei]